MITTDFFQIQMRTRNSLKGTDTEEETKSEKKPKKKNVKIEKPEEQSTSQGPDPPRRSTRVKKENSSSNHQEERPEDKPGPSGIQKQKTKKKNSQTKASQNKVQRRPMSQSSSETSKIPRKIPPTLQRSKISRSATPSIRRAKTETDIPLPPSPEPEMPELIPELIPVAKAESNDGPSNSLENKNDSSIPKQETKKVKEEKKPVMNGIDNESSRTNQNNPDASIIELDDIDDGVRNASISNSTECIVLSDNDSDDGIQVIGEIIPQKRFVSTPHSLVDLTNDPIIDPKPGPSGLQTKNR